MKTSCSRAVILACSTLLSGVGCSMLGGSKPKSEPSGDLVLSPIRTSNHYISTTELPQLQLRTALVEVTLRDDKVGMVLTVGMLRPHEGLFKMESTPQPCTSLQALIEALDPYIDRMPIGLILTVDGELPGVHGEPPAAFGAYVGQLLAELTQEQILCTFILPQELHIVR